MATRKKTSARSKKKKATAKRRPASKAGSKKKTRKKVTKRTPAKKAARKKSPAKKKAKKVTRKKTAAKKSPARKKAAKKKVAKKKVAKKKVAKKKPAKKAPVKKVAKKKTTKKAPARKKTAKKTAVKKAPASKKPAVRKKVTPRKPATRSKSTRVYEPDISNLLVTGPVAGIEPYKLRKGEKYMNKKQLKHFDKILRAWKKDLMQEVDRTVHHMKDEAANFPDPNDRATQESEFSLELRTRDRERKLIKKIDEAISTVDTHDYGYCESCGIEIGVRRLEARPTATQCIDCKTLDEIREKQMRA